MTSPDGRVRSVHADRLAGVTAVITGATGAIGSAIASRLGSEGAAIIVTDVSEHGGFDLVERLRRKGVDATFMRLDVSSQDDWTALAAAVDVRLRVLVNNAGVASPRDVSSEGIDGWTRVVDITQRGCWLGMKCCGPLIAANGGGSIVNVGSIFGRVGGFGSNIAYHAAKGAVAAMTRSASIHWAPQGVRVNVVEPGFVSTPALIASLSQEMADEIGRRTPMGRLGNPDEVAAAVAYLASDDSSFVTGTSLVIDGGWTAQ